MQIGPVVVNGGGAPNGCGVVRTPNSSVLAVQDLANVKLPIPKVAKPGIVKHSPVRWYDYGMILSFYYLLLSLKGHSF